MRKKKENEVEWKGFPTDEIAVKEIKNAIMATYDPFQQVEECKAEIKDIFDELHAKTGIPKKVFNFLAKANYNGDGDLKIQSNTELQEAYEGFMNVKED